MWGFWNFPHVAFNIPKGDVIMTINELCRKARKQSKIKVIDVAKGTGLPQSNVTMFEQGKSRSGKLITWYLIHTNLVELICGGELDE